MEKLIYALWRRPHHELAPIERWLVEDVAKALADDPGVLGARILVEAAECAIPGRPNPHGELCGLVSVWLPTYQDRSAIDELLRDGPVHDWHAWLVTESVPTPYGERLTWPLGSRSPGLTLVALFDKAIGLDEARFYQLWHVNHRRTTAEVHPLWCYVRNEIVRPLTPGAPPLRGIVYESVEDPEDLLDQERMVSAAGDPELFKANMALVADETTTFIDMASIQTQRMHEYLIRVVST